jgi:hypothetical protein
MPGKSKLTADTAERAALRGLWKSGQRGEADRARAILLTLEGRRAGEIATALGVHHISTQRRVPPPAIVEAMIEINHGLIHEAMRAEKIRRNQK